VTFLARIVRCTTFASRLVSALLAGTAFVAGPDDLGIDQGDGRVALLGHVDDDHAFVHVHLRGRQADALGFIHGLAHIRHQLAHARIDSSHRLGDGLQAGIGVAKNREQGHGITKD
jgi:hypothetical protein